MIYYNIQHSGSLNVSGSINLNNEAIEPLRTPTITSISPTSIKETDASYSFTVTGTNFDNGATGILIGSDNTEFAPTTSTRNSTTQLTLFYSSSARLTGSLEPYSVKVTNQNGFNFTKTNQVSVNDKPVWVTTDRIGTIYADTSLTASLFVSASDEEGDYPISYSLETGTLPTGLTFYSSSGEISGSSQIPFESASYNASGVQYNLSFKATDNTGVYNIKTFNILKKWLDGSSVDTALTSTSQAQQLSLSTGLRWFKNSIGNTQQLYYYDGYVLVASVNASSSTIPGGTGKNNLNYTLSRNGTDGALGTPSPNSDYIIGNFISNFSFSGVRGIGFGYNSTDGTYSFTNLGTYIDITWNTTSLTSVTNRSSMTIGGNSSIAANGLYGVVDAVLKDTSLNANANQATVGIAVVAASDGDPSNGCYYGHGTSEGSYEGWYAGDDVARDCQGYTTWLKS